MRRLAGRRRKPLALVGLADEKIALDDVDQTILVQDDPVLVEFTSAPELIGESCKQDMARSDPRLQNSQVYRVRDHHPTPSHRQMVDFAI